ncbi:CDGSH iron-sulfur domain-containing protein [Streptomyces roseus]|uniref:CDGSH iron-sulfur domain-containing protein n=1 Tax=Streptomyces roseus TaxID=66430 RepID=UPI0036977256
MSGTAPTGGAVPETADEGANATRMCVDPEGPVLVEGPVEIVMKDGTVARSDRFVVAVCTCRRTRTPPWCDTSHRRRTRAPSQSESESESDTESDTEHETPSEDT